MVNNVTYNYNYDFIGRPTYISGTNGHSMKFGYDSKNRLGSFSNIVNGFLNKISYVYGDTSITGQKPGLIYGVKIHDGQNDVQRVSYTYDDLSRLKTRTLNLSSNPITNYNTNYSYLAGGSSNTTTTMLGSVQNGTDASSKISYTYDVKGNISTITEGTTLKAIYTYDNLNQLVREDNLYINKSITYAYDVGGNMPSKVEYAYNLGTLVTPTSTIVDKVHLCISTNKQMDRLGTQLTG